MNKLLINPGVLRTVSFTLFIFSALFHYSCSGEKEKNDLSKLNLKGNIKILKESQYEVIENAGKVEKGKLSMISITLFDDQGYLAEKRFFASNGELWFRHVYRYNEQHNCIQEIRHDPDTKISSRTVMEYDDNNLKTQVSTYNQYGELMSKELHKYDNRGNIMETNRYNLNNTIVKKSTFDYDRKGNLIQLSNHNADGVISERSSYTFDGKGNMVTWINYDAAGKVKNSSEFKYEDFGKGGNWMRRIEYNNGDPNGIIEREMEYF